MSAAYAPARLVLCSLRPVRAPLCIARFLLAAAAVWAAAAGCVGTIEPAPLASDDEGRPQALALCQLDSDCVPAGPTCCSCPTFAVSRRDPVARACSNVACPISECAENVIARCNEEQRCELACAPRACDAAASCAYGFAIDVNGCLSCECAAPEPGGCAVDGDCARTRADCCGCRQGGLDTAVLASARASYDAMLGCSSAPACPGVDTCTADVPTCVQGRCELIAPDLPAGACGRADLPACPAGTMCLVNVSDQANMHGLGVCGAPP